MDENSKPNYFAIIPADVRYDKNLSSSAKLLYAEITSLTHKDGYCFASNKYFSNLYEVDERTVGRWLENLSECQYIEIETFKKGIFWNRKIFLKNLLRKDKNVQNERTKMSRTKGQKCPHNSKEYNNKENNNDERQMVPLPPIPPPIPDRPSASVVVSSLLRNIDIPESVKKNLTKKYNDEQIAKAIRATADRKFDNFVAAFQSALKEDWEPKKDPQEQEEFNRDYLGLLGHWDGRRVGQYVVDVFKDLILFRHSCIDGSRNVSYEVNEKGFKQNVKSFFDKHLQKTSDDYKVSA